MSHRHLYLPEEDHQPRTSRNMRQWAEQAEMSKKPIYRVKGRSALSRHISILTSVSVDYMHAVLEGVRPW